MATDTGEHAVTEPSGSAAGGVTLEIGGMTCATCALSIEKALKQQPGVAKAQVNLALERADIRFDAGQVALPELMQAVTQLGYTVRHDTVTLWVRGIDEEPLRQRLESMLEALDGVANVRANMTTGSVTVDLVRGVGRLDAVQAALRQGGFDAEVAPAVPSSDPRQAELVRARRNFGMALIFTLPVWVAMVHMLLGIGPTWLAMPMVVALSATIVQWGPGMGFTRRAWMNLRHRNANMDVLVALGTLAAWGLSVYDWGVGGPLYFDVSATVITLIILGKYFEALAKGRTGAAIAELLALQPHEARRKTPAGDWETVATDSVQAGDQIQVRAGDRIPVDGVVVEGTGAVDEAMLTGEPMPQEKHPGSAVSAGTVNGSTTLIIEATRVGHDTTLAHIVRTVEEAQATKAPVQRFADRVASVFVPSVMGIALVTLGAWGFGTGDWRHAILAAVAVLVVACPCALGLATPTAVMVGSGVGAKRGILYRSGEALEKMSGVTLVAMDKTGTLTAGRPRVQAIRAAEDVADAEVLGWAAALEQESSHPLARAIVGAAAEQGVRVLPAEDVYTEAGQGVVGMVNGAEVMVGNAALLHAYGVSLPPDPEETWTRWQQEGATVVWVARDSQWVGTMAVADFVRDDAVDLIQALHRRKIQVAMLTGDQTRTAEAVGHKLGVDRIFAELMPQDKARVIEQLRHEGYHVLMVGDGINDAPALVAADVGMAVGSGTDVAIEVADITLMAPEISGILRALTVGKKTLGKIRQNLFWAMIYNVILIPLAALGFLSPMIAGAAMAFSSVSVVTNSLLLRGMHLPTGEAQSLPPVGQHV